jgi:hypothetical protein
MFNYLAGLIAGLMTTTSSLFGGVVGQDQPQMPGVDSQIPLQTENESFTAPEHGRPRQQQPSTFEFEYMGKQVYLVFRNLTVLRCPIKPGSGRRPTAGRCSKRDRSNLSHQPPNRRSNKPRCRRYRQRSTEHDAKRR